MRVSRDLPALRTFIREHWKPLLAGGSGALVLASIVGFGSSGESRVIFKREGVPEFKNASILGNPGQAVLSGEEKLYTRQQRALLETQTQLKAEVEQLKATIRGMGGQTGTATSGPQISPVLDPLTAATPAVAAATPSSASYGPPEPALSTTRPVELSPPAEEYGNTRIKEPTAKSRSEFGFSAVQKSSRGGKPGASMISFPVKTTGAVYLKKPSITLPSGSYVKAKLLTGVEAPEGKTYPALLQLDYAYIIPNHKRLDLAGCFIIAKAQGDLSTERVQMQATKLSCVSKRGGMFEREVNGFIADDADNSFAVMGSVNTKQDRVAAMAFLSSVVSGISKAVQQAQTTQQATPLGGSQSIVTGDQAKYIGAGGASEAATMVTQWYLKQAQNLLPTINVGSGQDVWVIMQEQVDLPKDYFVQNGGGESSDASIYSHFTRLVE